MRTAPQRCALDSRLEFHHSERQKVRSQAIDDCLEAMRKVGKKNCTDCDHPGNDDRCCPDDGWDKCYDAMLSAVEKLK